MTLLELLNKLQSITATPTEINVEVALGSRKHGNNPEEWFELTEIQLGTNFEGNPVVVLNIR